MSKRGMETQGGGERYGSMGNERDAPDDKPRAATAAQMARRKIIQAKGKASARPSRQASPAVAGQPQANPFQSFQPPPSASGFSFNMPGSTPSPSFGQAAPPPQPNGGFGTPAPEQTNGTPSFGGFGNTSTNATPSFGSGFGSNNSQPPPNGFNPPATPSFGFGQSQANGTTTTPATSFNFGQTQTQSQEEPKQNGFKPSTFSFSGQQSQQTNGTTPSFSFGQSQQQEQQPPKPSTPSFGGFGQTAQPNGEKPVGTGLFGSTPTTDAAPKAGESIFSGISATPNGIKPGMFTASQQPKGEQTPRPSNPFTGISFGQQNKENQQEAPKPSFSFGDRNKQSEQPAQKPLFSLGQQNQSIGEQTPKPTNAFSGFKFGQPEQTPASEPAYSENEAPKAANLFNIGQQKEAEKPSSPFKFRQTQEQQTPKPAGTLFSGLGGSQPTGTSAFKSSASQQEDTSMMSPENTPQKQSSAQAAIKPAASTAQSATSEPETPANANVGKSLFDRISHDPPATAPRPSFSYDAPTTSSSGQSGEQGKSLFERLTPREPEPPATLPKPSTAPSNMPATPSAQPPPLFNTSAAPKLFTQPAQQSAPSTATTSAASSDGGKLRELNNGIIAHLKTEDPSKDWSVIFQYYMVQAAKLTGKDTFKPRAPAHAVQPATAPTSAFGSGNRFYSSPLKPTVPPTNAFGGSSGFHESPARPAAPPAGSVQIQAPAPPGHSTHAPAPQTPAPPSATNVFSQFSKPPATAPVNRKRSADEDLTKGNSTPEQPATEKRAKPSEAVHYPRLPETASKTAQLFASTLDKPVDTPINRLGPPDAAYNEVQKQKAAKEAALKAEAGHAAAPSSSFKPSTTFKFSSAAAPAREQPAETPKAPTFGFTPSTPVIEKPAETPKAPTFGFMPSTPAVEKPAEAPKVPTFGFTPSTSSASASATGGFKPTFTAPAGGSVNFLSSFGKKAESEEEKARKRRMDDDYDSDDEDKATWEAKDKAEQEAKKRRIEEAAKSGPVFSLPTGTTDKPASSAPFAFKLPSAEKAAVSQEPANPTTGKSLFERLTPPEHGTGKAPATSSQPSMFSAQTPAKSAPNAFGLKSASMSFSGSNFGQSKLPSADANKNGGIDKAQPEKEQGLGDNTWKPSTPIKFGAPTGKESTTPAAPPPSNPFAGLFGSSAKPATMNVGNELGKLVPPSVGFGFGAPMGIPSDASRATTPGLTTDGETSTAGDKPDEAEPSEQQTDKQIDDMTQLLPEEREAEDVLFQAEMAKVQKMDEKKTEDGYVRAWVEKGKGPLYILKNKTTGKTRVLLKIPPLGRAAMNFGPVKGFEYEHMKGKKIVRGTFFDHLDTNKEKVGKPSGWTMQVRDPSDAARLAKILNEEKEKQ